ncbi:pseudouridine synthase [Flavobacterium urocaniciphilum]|uniref:Ribosomal large subunit pseudouridine synthase B n=1 Tax=Flavobacterium urocaniciphilum TaxID=1299341 RepID=A0A1H9AER8_9FLAO|nr:pseudouridine synthase [Flavobacterium urocaniciphilum]SEP75159.1 ribosomal large subunit pseudouridine synthase B [Flavobacterium urocaniciphilum]
MRKASGDKRKGKPTENKKPEFKKTDSKKSYSRDNTPFQKFSKADKPKLAAKPKSDSDEIRLNKYVANSGVCSRRDADIYIQSGNVKVNGEVVTEMGYKVKLSDVVNFDGVTITPEKKEYILLNKPKNFSTEKNDNGATNALQLVRMATNSKIEPIGRMDKSTTGLLLYTNDTEMVRKFTTPNQRSSKIYQVSLDKNLKFEDLEKIKNGINIDGHKVYVEEIAYIDNEPKSEIGIKMKTANVKIVRNIFEQLKYDVIKLDRVVFAGLTKKNLPRGNWRFLTEQEIINLKNI